MQNFSSFDKIAFELLNKPLLFQSRDTISNFKMNLNNKSRKVWMHTIIELTERITSNSISRAEIVSN